MEDILDQDRLSYDDEDDSDASHEREDEDLDSDVDDEEASGAEDDEDEGDEPESRSRKKKSSYKDRQEEADRMRRRHNGATRKVNELMNRVQQLEGSLARSEQEKVQVLEQMFYDKIQDLDEDTRRAKISQWNQAKAMHQNRQQQQYQESQMTEVAKRNAMYEVMAQYPEIEDISEITNFDSRAEMEIYAENLRNKLEKYQRTQKRDQRKTRKKSTNFENQRQTSTPPKDPKTMGDAREALLRLATSR